MVLGWSRKSYSVPAEITSFLPGLIQGWSTLVECKVSSFVSGVNQGDEEMR